LYIEAKVTDTKTELELARGFINPKTFPLPILSVPLAAISQDIHQGRSFSLIRGLETDKYSDEDNDILFSGLAAHVGSRRGIGGSGLAMSQY
jgi:hypothetical protein